MFDNRHEVAVTAIIVKDGKYLITRRAMSKKRFPGRWTVPGGKLEVSDYANSPKDTADYWYNVLEKVIAREVKEEVGLKIKNISYLISLATVHKNGVPSLVISLIADYDSGGVSMQKEELDKHEWVSLEEAKSYDLIDGIYDELVMAENYRKGKRVSWRQ